MGNIPVVGSSAVDIPVVGIPGEDTPAVDRSTFAAAAVRKGLAAVGMRLLKHCSLLVRTGAPRWRRNNLSLRLVRHLRRRWEVEPGERSMWSVRQSGNGDHRTQS